MDGIPRIVCGESATDGLGKVVIEHLNGSISKFTDRAIVYLRDGDPSDLLIFGPFCGRVILENGCAAIVGRLDPFRLMYLSEFQAQPEYVLGKRVRSAFSWTGDVIPEEKQSAVMWDADHDMAKIGRSLLSKHFDHIYWKPALNSLLDHVAGRSDPELSDILAIDPEKYVSSMKGKLSQLYSQLSKGVHWEFYSSSLQLDEITIKTLLRDTIVHVANLGLVSHFIPTAFSTLSPDNAVDAYIGIRKAVP